MNNDTQGFRDAYIKINQAFTATATEITNLQLQVNNIASSSTVFAQNITDAVTATVWASLSSTLSTSTAVSYRLGAPTDATGGPGDLKGMIYATSSTIYVCYRTWVSPGGTPIWSKVTTTAW